MSESAVNTRGVAIFKYVIPINLSEGVYNNNAAVWRCLEPKSVCRRP